jgi:DNA-binding CsgD family transcriptional regulator
VKQRHPLLYLTHEHLQAVSSIGVYSIHTAEGLYIGLTFDSFDTRWKGHISRLRQDAHHCRALQKLYNLRGISVLEFRIEHEFEPENSNVDLPLLEQQTWDRKNLEGSVMLHKRPTGKYYSDHSSDTKRHISARMKEVGYSKLHRIDRQRVTNLAQNPHCTMDEGRMELGISYGTLHLYCKTNEIEWITWRSRKYIEGVVFKNLDDKLDEVKSLIVSGRYSKVEIAQILGVTVDYLTEFCQTRQIEPRAFSAKPANRKLRDNHERILELVELKTDDKEIARALDVNIRSLRFYLKSREIKYD